MRPEYFLAWRRSQGLTQMDAAKLFRVQETVISAIERGRISGISDIWKEIAKQIGDLSMAV
jgi:DNA-binding XRE family transcriptional regulator